MGKSLLKLPVFAAAIDKCQEALKPYGVDVINILTSDDPVIFSNILNCFVGIAAFQVCFSKQIINVTLRFSKEYGSNFKIFRLETCLCITGISVFSEVKVS
jgi:hypothetical protein